VWDHDARFAAVKVFAVDALGGVPGLPVSRALLKIVRAQPGPGGPPVAAQERAGAALVARKDRAAVPLMLEALAEHYDFLEDKQPRGVDVLARALGALDVKEAAPLLAAHLADHETPERALEPVAETLAHLGGADAEHALREFLLEYHADPAFLLDPSPLTAAGDALVASSGPGDEARRAVAFVVGDARTLQPLSRQLRVTLDEATAREQQKKQEQGGAQAAPEKQE
ncbi:MAG: hypothetical protein LC659_05760, partial [Myxococcales bacterium]|nr:hypothetical protein [Myxococcales bacterium]